jgi:hypothetical protein
MDLKMQIHSLQKRHVSMQSYLDQKRSLADRHRLISSLVSDANLQLFILHRLGIDYDSILVSLTSKSEAVPFNKLSVLLLIHEQRLNKHALTIAGSSPPSFSATLSTANSALSGSPQANIVSSLQGKSLNSSTIFGPLI